MKKLLLFILILSACGAHAQSPRYLANKNEQGVIQGLLKADSGMTLKLFDTTTTKAMFPPTVTYPKIMDNRLAYQNGRLWIFRAGAFALLDSVNIDLSTYAKKPYVDSGLTTKEPVITPGIPGQYFSGNKTWQVLDRAAVGLPFVDNTSDINKPVSTAQQAAINASAPLNSVSARVSLPYTKAINTVGDIRLSDSGDITLTPDFNNPQAGATASIVITGDGVHNIYAPSYIIPEGSNFKNSTIHKYLFKSTYDGTRYYGEFTRLFDTINCPGFLPPVTGMFYSFIGDSWTAGQGVANPYPVKFAALAGGTAINNGVSGMAMQKTTAWPNYFNPSSIASDYDSIAYTFIALGINDYLRYSAGTFGFSSYGYLDAYTTALDTAFSPPRNQKRKKLVLIAPFYVPAVTVPLDTQFRYVQIARSLAKSYGLPLIDLWTKMRDLPGINTMFQGDNLHPNQALQDSIGTWIFNSDFRTETQKLCTGSGMPALNKANASQQGLTDSMQKAMERIRVQENTAVHNGLDSPKAPMKIGSASRQPLWFYSGNLFTMAITPGGQIAINKSMSAGAQLDVHGKIQSDSVMQMEWSAHRRNDITTMTSWVVPSFPNYSAGKVFRANSGFSWFLTFDSTKYLKSYDLIQGYSYKQTSSVDTFRGVDGSTTVPLSTSYEFAVTRVTAPNLPMMQGHVTFTNAGVPVPKITVPNGSITVSVVNNKVVFSTASGQLNVGTWPYIDRSGNGFYALSSYFMARDSLKKEVGIGPFFTVSTLTGAISVGASDTFSASTLADAQSTTKGTSFIPRMTKAQRNAISGPYLGLKAIVTDGGYESMHNGINWMGDIVTSSASTLTLTYGTHYINTGGATTWTLPAVSASVVSFGNAITIKNRGSGDITLNSNAGSTIYSTSAVSSITIAAGSAVLLMPDGTFFNVE